MSGLRLRKRPLEVVQELDAFSKVPENVQEAKNTRGGAISLVSFALIAWLVIGEIGYYLDTDYKYSFRVDKEFNESLNLEVDLVVRMDCSLIGADIVDIADRSVDPGSRLKMSSTKFDLTDRQKKYWNVLREAQRQQSKPGQSFKSLDNFLFVANSVIRGLKSESDQKESELKSGGRVGPEDGFLLRGGIRIISMDGGVLEFFSGPKPGAGGACRVHGRVPIAKVAGNLHISPGKTLPLGGGAHAHLNFFGTDQDYNFSHRIERFSFGPRVSGLVAPLAGTEKISDNNMDLYQYYIQVVPTKVYSAAASLGLQDPISTYQYSVTHRKRAIHHSKGSHGIPGLNFKYDLSPMTVEVRESARSLAELLVRLCAVVGGIFATSGVLNGLVGFCFDRIWGGAKKKSETVENKGPSDRSTGQTFVT